MNVTGEDIDLTGWVLRWRKKEPKTEDDLIWREIPLRGTISAYGLFLLERGHDEVVRDIPADLIYPKVMLVGTKEIPLLFSLEGDVVELLDPTGRVVDTANADPRRPRGWAAGDARTHATMERRSPYLPDLDEHWWTNLGLVVQGVDAKEQEIRGTPLSLNEPELLNLAGEAVVLTRGQKLSFTRLAPVGRDRKPRVWILQGDVLRGAGVVRALDPSIYELLWDEVLELVTLTVYTQSLEPGDYRLIIGLANHWLVANLRIVTR